jgi:hypothetical protein
LPYLSLSPIGALQMAAKNDSDLRDLAAMAIIALLIALLS